MFLDIDWFSETAAFVKLEGSVRDRNVRSQTEDVAKITLPLPCAHLTIGPGHFNIFMSKNYDVSPVPNTNVLT